MRRGRKRNLPSSSGSKKKLECSRVYKRRAKKKEKHENEVDMISNLPDHILHHIFSSVDIKQAIQTCILSRRWRYFWGSLPTLKFTYDEGNRKTITNQFMNFVDRVLMFRSNSSTIDVFTLVTNHSIDVTDRLNTWILASVIRNVQQLTLHTNFPKKFHFHQSLFTCKSLTKLVVNANFNQVRISLPDSFTLPRLKTLSLNFVTFKDGDKVLDHIFSSCPVLESLIIRSCVFLLHNNINISSPQGPQLQLQHLVIQYCETRKQLLDPVDIKFKLCAPNLISFCYNDAMSTCFDLKNLCSLVKADINIYIDSGWSKKEKSMYFPYMVNILRELHNAEDLTLSTSFLEVITGAADLLDSQPTKFYNLKRLKLKGTWLSQSCIPAISYLLKISPNIETLLILDEKKAGNAATDLLDVQPTHFCNLRFLKMHTLFSRDWIYAIACLLKICPNTETLSYTLYHNKKDCDEIMNPYCDEINSDRVTERDYWETGLSLEGLLNHVKCFEVRYVTGRINELKFIEILLKNAMQLEKLLIEFETTYSDTLHIKFSEKVLTFPRASPSVVILFKFSEE